jgi:hypothetical protein
MNKPIFALALLVLSVTVALTGCEKKSTSDAISPTFGSTGNPNPNNPTVTGNAPASNPATENTAISVGGSGWSNPTCGTTYSIMLKGVMDETDVTLNFGSIIKSGPYVIGATTGSAQCTMVIVNAPNQPKGIVWYGKSGSVTVNTTSTSISATFKNVVCTQQSFNFPTVVASGTLSCGQ